MLHLDNSVLTPPQALRPAESVLPGRRSCLCDPHAQCQEPHSRLTPDGFRLPHREPRTLPSHMPPRPARAALCDPACRWASGAATPGTRTPPEPCTREDEPSDANEVLLR